MQIFRIFRNMADIEYIREDVVIWADYISECFANNFLYLSDVESRSTLSELKPDHLQQHGNNVLLSQAAQVTRCHFWTFCGRPRSTKISSDIWPMTSRSDWFPLPPIYPPPSPTPPTCPNFPDKCPENAHIWIYPMKSPNKDVGQVETFFLADSNYRSRREYGNLVLLFSF